MRSCPGRSHRPRQSLDAQLQDGLAITGKGPVVRRFPMVPGIDLVGTIRSSTHADYQPGDSVLLNGWGVGEDTGAGSPRRHGSGRLAGSAAQTVFAAAGHGDRHRRLYRHAVRAGAGAPRGDAGAREILVSGAAGGVGSVATTVLAKLGYTVVAVSGRTEEADYLKRLGASEVLNRARILVAGQTAGQRNVGAAPSMSSAVTPGKHLRHHQVSRRGNGMRAGRRDGFSGDGRAVHPSWRDAGRY